MRILKNITIILTSVLLIFILFELIRIFSLNENIGLFFFILIMISWGLCVIIILKILEFFFKNDDLYRDIKYTKLSIRQKRKFFLIFIFQLICMSAIYHNPVILAITSLSKSFSPKYLLFNL